MPHQTQLYILGLLLTISSVSILVFYAIGSEASEYEYKQSDNVTDFEPVPFSQLVGMANIIVTGKIESIEEYAFQFYIEEFLSGHHTNQSITVKKYTPPQFITSKTSTYKKNRRFVLFLSDNNTEQEKTWAIIGIAGEGEMPIDNKYVYFSAYNLNGLEYTSQEVHGVIRKLQRYNLNNFKDAVKNYTSCFSWRQTEYIINNKVRRRWVPSKVCSNNALSKFHAKGWLHEYLVNETLKKIP